jgi:hypothetical protein
MNVFKDIPEQNKQINIFGGSILSQWHHPTHGGSIYYLNDYHYQENDNGKKTK